MFDLCSTFLFFANLSFWLKLNIRNFFWQNRQLRDAVFSAAGIQSPSAKETILLKKISTYHQEGIQS